ncbi:IPT/TIG domain-containing protein [Nocardioides dilutus]
MGGRGVGARLAVGLSLVLAFGVVAGPVHAGVLTASRVSGVVATASEQAERVAPTRAAKVAKPVVKRVKPSSGPTAGGTVVKIKGKRFVKVKKVLFGTAKGTNLRVKNPRKVIVVAPARAAGSVAVRVVTKAGKSKKTRRARFTYVAAPVVPAPPRAPVITSLDPSSGPTAGGTVVDISGTGLSGTTSVSFGGVPAPFTVLSDAAVRATSPAHAAGAVPVTVQTPAGTSAPLSFTYQAPAPPPVVVLVAPPTGPVTGGTAVTITGTGFTGATAVEFDGTAATSFTVDSDTSISATTPAHAAGPVAVSVTTPVDTSTVPGLFTYLEVPVPPVVVLVTPPTGPVTGGTAVTITGTGFTGATAVEFDGTAATSFTVDSDTSISATTPAHAAGPVAVSVTTPVDTSTVPGLFTYLELPAAPVVVLVLPATGPPSGGTAVTITGTGFTGATAVEFGGTAATSFTVDSDTSISATTPAHALGPVSVSVTTPGGTSTVPGLFTYLL